MDDRPVEGRSAPEPVPASLATYEFNDDKRPRDSTLPQNRPNRVEEPSPPERAISMASDDQASLNEQALDDMSQIGYMPLKVSPCANIVHTTIGGTTQNCHQDGTMSCGKCHLVRVSSPPTNLVPSLKYHDEDQTTLRSKTLCRFRLVFRRISLIRPVLTFF